ncbi:cytochrome P450 [Streptomyces sp. LP05-1]|uniref:Cytochrome P450 n=1 Tax=Streptomyces pyxinae TaxID=2970734 RepID=A0ABT2CGC0_9ACTN|nr:cytochrome P450 [Streptomyces sp. LP05-1]MCS0636461.1 cytochrome P450 [Streptomyces sp. LP05-1]
MTAAKTATADPDLPLRYPFPPGELGTPPPVLAWARKYRPVCPVRLPSGTQVWMVTRKTDIAQVLTDARFSRNLVYEGAPRFVGEDFTSMAGGIFNLDPPDHTRVRRVISHFYTRAGAESYRPMVRRHAARLLDAMAEGPNPADLVPAYTAPLPLAVSSEILRVPVEQRDAYHSYFRTQTNLAVSAGEIAAATRAVIEFTGEVIEAKRREDRGGNDRGPIEALIRARAAGEISESELQGTVAYLFVTGSEPLVSPLGTGVVTLLVHPRQLRACINDPALWPRAVEEVLRYHHNGVLGLPRVATEDVRLHGVTIAKGDGVCTPMLGATWDPAHYPNPAKFNIHRRTDGTATFGAGPHFCLGAALARMFLTTAYEALFTRFPGLLLAVSEYDIPWELDLFFTKPATLPVAWA